MKPYREVRYGDFQGREMKVVFTEDGISTPSLPKLKMHAFF